MLVAVASVIAFFAAGALADCRKFEIAPVMARTSQMRHIHLTIQFPSCARFLPTLTAGGCTGHGLCGPNDKCACDPNYFGADCSLRSCPHDYAFVDTPAGDLNHDGQISPGGYVEVNGQVNYEMFPTDADKGGFAAQTDEAHFYAECSGKGSCDRALGECVCYAGFTGAACQRSEWRIRCASVASRCLRMRHVSHSLFLPPPFTRLQALAPTTAVARAFAALSVRLPLAPFLARRLATKAALLFLLV
jgi:hypothetical protein